MTGYICLLNGNEIFHAKTFGSASELSKALKNYEKILEKDEEILICPDADESD